MSDALVVCNRSGVPYAELENAAVEHMSWTLTPFAEPGALNFTIPTLDLKGLEVKLLEREVQFWRDGKCRWWGVPTRRSATREATQVQCSTLERYVGGNGKTGRYFGPSPSLAPFGYPTTFGTTVSTPADFGASLTGWSAVGCTATVSASTTARGAKAFKLVRTGAAGSDAYLEFTFDWTVPDLVPGGGDVPVFVPGYFFIESLSPAYKERGLYVQTQSPIGTSYDVQWAPITAATPVNGWFRLETVVKARATASPTVNRFNVRLYCPGTIYWDAINVFRPSTVGAAISSSGPEFLDLGVYLERVWDHVSGLPGGGGVSGGSGATANDLGKSNLNIGRSIPACGVNGYRNWNLADNGSCAEVFAEHAERGIYDFAITHNDAGTTRTLTAWAPRRGSAKPELALELGRNISDFTYTEDAEATATKPRVLGRGEGASREIGEAMDTNSLGGLTMESVETAAADTPLAHLDERAAELLRISKIPVKVATVQTKEGVADDLLGNLLPGDTAPVRIKHGWIDHSATSRITKVELSPKDNTMAFTFGTQ